MVKTQVQIPDHLYEAAKKIAESRELSFAEVVRRGLEYVVSVYSLKDAPKTKWTPPKPRSLGKDDPFEDEDWRMKVNMSGVMSLIEETPAYGVKKRRKR